MKNNRQRIISKTMERMAGNDHLPQDLVSLLGQTAKCQAEATDSLTLDLSGIDMSRSPLCLPTEFPLDRDHFSALAEKLIDLILTSSKNKSAPMFDAGQVFKSALLSDSLPLEAALRELQARFTGHIAAEPVLSAWAKKTPKAPSAMAFLAVAAAAPALEAAALALAAAAGHNPDKIHATGDCPVCGSLPYILELREKEGQRFAHCAHCRHTYRIRRIACACCNTDTADQLKYFTVDGEPGYRVDTCEACKTYIKTMDFRKLDREVFAPLNDLESMALDILAENEGYHRMASSVWCI